MRRIISQSNPAQKCVRTNRQGHQSSYYNGVPYVQKLSRAMENLKKMQTEYLEMKTAML